MSDNKKVKYIPPSSESINSFASKAYRKLTDSNNTQYSSENVGAFANFLSAIARMKAQQLNDSESEKNNE